MLTSGLRWPPTNLRHRDRAPVNPGTQALYHLRFVGLSVRGADADRLACHQHDRPELGVVVDFNNQASYIDDRLGALKTEKKATFRAAAEALRVADYILGLPPDYPAAHSNGADNARSKIRTTQHLRRRPPYGVE